MPETLLPLLWPTGPHSSDLSFEPSLSPGSLPCPQPRPLQGRLGLLRCSSAGPSSAYLTVSATAFPLGLGDETGSPLREQRLSGHAYYSMPGTEQRFRRPK